MHACMMRKDLPNAQLKTTLETRIDHNGGHKINMGNVTIVGA